MNSKFMPENTRIAVIGGGNIGTQFACVCAVKGYCVNLFSSKPDLYDGILEVVDQDDNVIAGKVNKVASDIREVIEGCNVIFVTYPASLLKNLAAQMMPYIKPGMNICIVPGTGGAEFAFHGCVTAGAVLLGIQRVPTVARLEQYGKRVRCEGLRSELFLGAIPGNMTEGFAQLMCYLWDIPCKTLPNYLSVTLTPSNPILHTTRLRTLFSDYEDGRVYENNPLFYGEWTDDSSALLIACDEELQGMCRRLDRLDLNNVRSLKIHYESNTVEDMTKKLSSIKSLHNLHSPMKQVEGGWIPDFKSRYFTADFPYGLAIIEGLAEVLNYNMPNVRETMNWYRKVTRDNNCLHLADYGIKTIEDIYAFY